MLLLRAASEPKQVASIFECVVKASEGAGPGTGTTVEHEVIHGIYAVLANDALAKAMDKNLRAVAGVTYMPEETAFAETLRKSFGPDAPPLSRGGLGDDCEEAQAA